MLATYLAGWLAMFCFVLLCFACLLVCFLCHDVDSYRSCSLSLFNDKHRRTRKAYIFPSQNILLVHVVDMDLLFVHSKTGLVIITCLLIVTAGVALYSHFATSTPRTYRTGPPSTLGLKGNEAESVDPPLTALQQHVLFWTRRDNNLIYPQDVYNGFREIGFSIPFAITALLIPLFFSYPTRLSHSIIPDPLFRIYVDGIHKAKHGSDSGIYDLKGNFRPQAFEDLFVDFDESGTGGLGVSDLFSLLARNRVAADPAGWSFAVMEWSTTWLLLQRDGRVWKEDLRACYDGSLFWKLKQEREKGEGVKRGYGWMEFFGKDQRGQLFADLRT